MPYNRVAIRTLVDTALTENELLTLCEDYFPEVSNQFTTGQTKGPRVRLLLNWAERHRAFDTLLAAVQKANPIAYAEYEKNNPPDTPLLNAPTISPPMLIETCDVLVRSIYRGL
jgi:hypothetical protein